MFQLQAHSSRALSSTLSHVVRNIGKKNTMPILDNVLLTCEDGKFFFTSASLDSQLTTEAPLSLITGNFGSPVAIPADGLLSLLSTLPDCAVNLKFEDNNNSIIVEYCFDKDGKTKSGSVTIIYFDGQTFPMISAVKRDDATSITVPADVFLNAVDQSKLFSCEDMLRPVMSAMLIEVNDGATECYFVSSDGRRLFKGTHRMNPETDSATFGTSNMRSFMLSRNHFKSMSVFAGSESVTLTYDGRMICITDDKSTLTCKTIEGNYPNYNSVIPRNNPYYVVFDKKEMLDTIKRVSIFGDTERRVVKLTRSGMYICVDSRNEVTGTTSSEEAIALSFECNDDMNICVATDIFTNAVSAVDGATVKMSFIDGSRAIICSSEDPNPKVITLAMPVRG